MPFDDPDSDPPPGWIGCFFFAVGLGTVAVIVLVYYLAFIAN